MQAFFLNLLLLCACFAPLFFLRQAPSQVQQHHAESQLLHPASPMPSFSVVSVTPSKPGGDSAGGHTDANSYRAQQTTVKEVLNYAFGLGYDQEMIKPPSWVSRDRFDIIGKLDDKQIATFSVMDRDAREVQMRLMVQSLLRDRFHLAFHFEARELPVYRLQVAKGGFKCPRDSVSPPALDDPARPRFRMSAAPPPPPPPPGWQPPSQAELKRLQQSMHLHTRGWPFWLLVTVLSHQPELNGKPVLDETGLNGAYECDLMWSREGTEGTGQDFFPAVLDQLGLRFQPGRGTIEVLVVDNIDQPSPN